MQIYHFAKNIYNDKLFSASILFSFYKILRRLFMANPQWVIDLFGSIDSMDSDKFASFLTDDCEFTFGNADSVIGNENVKTAVAGFFSSIKALSHTDIESFIDGNVTISRGIVTYTRHNDTKLTVDYCNIFRLNGKKIQKYTIYVDISQLYA